MTESKLVKKLNENQKKVEPADIEKINELRDGYKTQTVKIGQLNVERILMNQAVDRLNDAIVSEEKAYVDLQEKERELVKELQEKYGIGQLNLDNGTFTAVKSK
tara:strand:+ start:3508 stop:3819 length:312 start_codon:yes stop_codon:yes gene_type:complete